MNQTLTPIRISKQAIDLTGKTFGRYKVLFPVSKDSRGVIHWMCECSCGNKKAVDGSKLRDGSIVSCGCYRRELSTTHGKHKTKEYVLWHGCRARAAEKCLDFDLELEDIVIPDICPCLGIEIIPGTNYGQDNSPSVDRIDPSKGYTKDNIWVISHKANRIKNNATIQELKSITAAIIGKTALG